MYDERVSYDVVSVYRGSSAWCSVGVGTVSNVVQFPVKCSVPVSNPVSESYSMDVLRLQYMMAMRNIKGVVK